LVGESGSGKTTLAKVLTGQLRPEAGTVALDGEILPDRRSRRLRSSLQMVFQDPYSSLDPRMTIRQTLSELLRLVVRMPRQKIEARCAELLAQVGLSESALDGYPGQFSGGQRQRIAIARALAVDPTVLVADEPTSALDVSVQAAVLDQLGRLRDDLGLTIVVISHDLAVIRHICDDVFVLRSGAVVESGTAAQVLDRPRDPYTQQLIRAVPRLPNRSV
jgi:peptide/nickel transport system ATP-binding protein